MSVEVVELVKRQDFFSFNGATILVNPVNCVGAMGKGIAKDFKSFYPAMFAEYYEACYEGFLRPGTTMLVKCHNRFTKKPMKVLLFPTKDHWQDPSELEWIRDGLENCILFLNKEEDVVLFPLLGCGEGGLDSNVVLPIMKKALGSEEVKARCIIATLKSSQVTGGFKWMKK